MAINDQTEYGAAGTFFEHPDGKDYSVPYGGWDNFSGTISDGRGGVVAVASGEIVPTDPASRADVVPNDPISRADKILGEDKGSLAEMGSAEYEQVLAFLRAGKRDSAVAFVQAWINKQQAAGKRVGVSAETYVDSVAKNVVVPAAKKEATDVEQRRPLERGGIFQRFLRQRMPGYESLPPGLRNVYEKDFPALETTFDIERIGQGKSVTDPDQPSFEQFLESGRPAFTAGDIFKRFTDLGHAMQARPEGLTNRERDLRDFYSGGGGGEGQFGGENRAFEAVVGPYLQGIDPHVRSVFRNRLVRDFQKMRYDRPGKTYLQLLNEMQGRYFD